MWKRAAVIAGLLLLGAVHARETGFEFGVFPNLSPRLLIETYRPVAEALSRKLNQPVALQTAPDFKTFFERTQAGEYDLVLTAPHLAWLAVKHEDYKPLFTYERETEGVLVVRADSGFKSAGDLRGKTIVMADSLAITVMRMEKELAGAGLSAGRDFVKIETGSHNNAALHVYEGKSDAAIMGGLPFLRLGGDMRKNLRIIKVTQSFPGQVYLAGPRIKHVQEQAIREALADFMKTPQGKAFLAQGGFEGLRPIGSWELRQFDADGHLVRQRLNAAREGASR